MKKIKEFRFIELNDTFLHKEFQNWSRCYEWGYAIEEAKKLPLGATVHNTACGWADIHRQFHEALNSVVNVTHSDAFESDITRVMPNFCKYDILMPPDNKYDMVLCISTLEHISDPNRNIPVIIKNLWEQVKNGGRLIVTADYPEVTPEGLRRAVEQACGFAIEFHEGKGGIILDNMNSPFPTPRDSLGHIILLDLQK